MTQRDETDTGHPRGVELPPGREPLATQPKRGIAADLLERARHHAGVAEDLLQVREGVDPMPAVRASLATAHASLAVFYCDEAAIISFASNDLEAFR